MATRKPLKRTPRSSSASRDNPPDLSGMRIAILATDGFEQSELTDPKRQLERAQAEVDVLAPDKTRKRGQIRAWKMKDWGKTIRVAKPVRKADVDDYSALILPGGVINPDRLRLDEAAVNFIRDFAATGKPVAAICHGPQVLIEADLVRNRRVTSWPSLKTDLRNAGAEWVDEEVVTDGNLITSRKPDDIPAFASSLIRMLAGTRPQEEPSALQREAAA